MFQQQTSIKAKGTASTLKKVGYPLLLCLQYFLEKNLHFLFLLRSFKIYFDNNIKNARSFYSNLLQQKKFFYEFIRHT